MIKLRSWLMAGAIGTTLAIASPALAFHGGMGGGGGHMGGGMGGMRMGGGGMHMGGGWGGPHVGAGFAGPRTSFAAVRPGFSTFGRPGIARPFAPRFSRFAFHDRFFFRHHRRFFFGAPFAFAAASYDTCWRRLWTAYGPRWVNVCYGNFYDY